MKDLLRIIGDLEKSNERKDVECQELSQQLQLLQLRQPPEKNEVRDIKNSLSKGDYSIHIIYQISWSMHFKCIVFTGIGIHRIVA